MKEWRDAGKEGIRKEGRKDIRDKGKEKFRTGGIHILERRNSGLEGYKKG